MSRRAIESCMFWTHKGFKNVNNLLYVFFQLYPLVWSSIFLWWRPLKKRVPCCDAAGAGRAAGMSCCSPRERAGGTRPVLPKMQCFSAAPPRMPKARAVWAKGRAAVGHIQTWGWCCDRTGSSQQQSCLQPCTAWTAACALHTRYCQLISLYIIVTEVVTVFPCKEILSCNSLKSSKPLCWWLGKLLLSFG